jgi:hypothetical protein
MTKTVSQLSTSPPNSCRNIDVSVALTQLTQQCSYHVIVANLIHLSPQSPRVRDADIAEVMATLKVNVGGRNRMRKRMRTVVMETEVCQWQKQRQRLHAQLMTLTLIPTQIMQILNLPVFLLNFHFVQRGGRMVSMCFRQTLVDTSQIQWEYLHISLHTQYGTELEWEC